MLARDDQIAMYDNDYYEIYSRVEFRADSNDLKTSALGSLSLSWPERTRTSLLTILRAHTLWSALPQGRYVRPSLPKTAMFQIGLLPNQILT
jgi:hypothetical protein